MDSLHNDFFFEKTDTEPFLDFMEHGGDGADKNNAVSVDVNANNLAPEATVGHKNNMSFGEERPQVNDMQGNDESFNMGVNLMNMNMNMEMNMVVPSSLNNNANMNSISPVNMSDLGMYLNSVHDVSFGLGDQNGNMKSASNVDGGINIENTHESNTMSMKDIHFSQNYADSKGGQKDKTGSFGLDCNNNPSNNQNNNEAKESNNGITPFASKSSPRKSIDKRRSSIEDSTSQQKRSRASGEMLDYLMSEFAKHPNPSAQTRKEISVKTGMPERSVRIWFQNRRAKARKMVKLNQKDPQNSQLIQHMGQNLNSNLGTETQNISSRSSFSNISPLDGPRNYPDNPGSNPINSYDHHNNSEKNNDYNNQQQDMTSALNKMNNLPLEIKGKYYLIECKGLSVGTWQRIRAGYVKTDSLDRLNNLSPKVISEIMKSTDLIVILSKKDQELNYFFSGSFNNERVLFRIFYPVMSILKCSLLNQTQQMINNSNNRNKNNNQENNNLQQQFEPNGSELHLELGASPQFAVHLFSANSANSNQWSICEDFSEGQQVANAFMGPGGTGQPHILNDDIGRLTYLNTLIAAMKKNTKAEEQTVIRSQSVDFGTTVQPNYIPTNMNHSVSQSMNMINPSTSPMNRSTNNSTPGSVSLIPNYTGFSHQPSHLSLSTGTCEDSNASHRMMINDNLITNDILYGLNSEDTGMVDHNEKIFLHNSNNHLTLDGLFTPGGADSDLGDSKVVSNDLDLFNQRDNSLNTGNREMSNHMGVKATDSMKQQNSEIDDAIGMDMGMQLEIEMVGGNNPKFNTDEDKHNDNRNNGDEKNMSEFFLNDDPNIDGFDGLVNY